MESEWAVMEMAGAELADARQVTSITRICAALEERPELSFSAAWGPGRGQAGRRVGGGGGGGGGCAAGHQYPPYLCRFGRAARTVVLCRVWAGAPPGRTP